MKIINDKHKIQRRVTGTQGKLFLFFQRNDGRGERISERKLLRPEKCVRGNTYSLCFCEASGTGLEDILQILKLFILMMYDL